MSYELSCFTFMYVYSICPRLDWDLNFSTPSLSVSWEWDCEGRGLSEVASLKENSSLQTKVNAKSYFYSCASLKFDLG